MDENIHKVGTLYVVATPIGNLSDASPRSIEILKSVDFLIAENPKISQTFLKKFEIDKPVAEFHQHVSPFKLAEIMIELAKGFSAAYISDAGTPTISDPGSRLVSAAADMGCPVIGIPGPSAATTLFSISGVASNRYYFLGFMPKKDYKKLLEGLKDFPDPIIFYESPYRLYDSLEILIQYGYGDYYCVVGRELTKKFETTYRGTVKSVRDLIYTKDEYRGEFTVLIAPPNLAPDPKMVIGPVKPSKVGAIHTWKKRLYKTSVK
jgi:16S rRNA (cytidine1402-2'-O)-methyltransferase